MKNEVLKNMKLGWNEDVTRTSRPCSFPITRCKSRPNFNFTCIKKAGITSPYHAADGEASGL